MEEIKYYRTESGKIFRTRETDTEAFTERLDGGKWIHDADIERYLFDGEQGAEEISEAEATKNLA